MEEIIAGTSRLVGAVRDITAALREQSAAHDQVARNVERVAQMAEGNTAEMMRIAAAARELDGLADTLHSAVGRFRI